MPVIDLVDESWRPVAEDARKCISLLGFPARIEQCMPGEQERGTCPGTVAQHALSYLAIISAIVDHQLAHLRAPGFEEAYQLIYERAVADIGACPAH